MKRAPHRGVPLRLRLALVYAGLTAAVCCALGIFVYGSLRRSLVAILDRSLETALVQIADDVEYPQGVPAFDSEDGDDDGERTGREAAGLDADDVDVAVRLLSPDGLLVLGAVGPAADLPPRPIDSDGYSVQRAVGGAWRLYSRALNAPDGRLEGWLQAIASLDPVEETLAALLSALAVGLPLLLLAAGAAGTAMAARALRPIEDVAAAAASITDEDLGRRIGYRGSVSEVSRLAGSFDRMLERLQAAFERERRFTSDAAHELRTPLTALKGQIEVALRRARSPLAYRRTLAALEVYVDRLIRLADDLLFMARMDHAARPAGRIEIRLNDLLSAVAEQISHAARGRGIRLRLEAPRPVTVRADMDQLIRLFLNLLDNAVRYTQDKGRIRISVQNGDGAAVVEIANTGEGIPPADLPFVFDRFFRVAADRSRRTGGAGLGLAIAREIARAHGGSIAARSEPGVLTTFTVSLPGAPPREGAPADAVAAEAVRAGSRVLDGKPRRGDEGAPALRRHDVEKAAAGVGAVGGELGPGRADREQQHPRGDEDPRGLAQHRLDGGLAQVHEKGH
jgi:heavy metal sensor kinase